jgi:hypothetical protein
MFEENISGIEKLGSAPFLNWLLYHLSNDSRVFGLEHRIILNAMWYISSARTRVSPKP